MLSKRVVLLVVVLCCVSALVPTALFSQETTAGVQGYVKDPTGAVVAGATVEISGPALGAKKTETDATGFYRFSSLPPGTYTLTVTAKGFRVVKRDGVSLEVGRLPNIDIQLEIGSASEIVEVRGEAPAVDVTQSKVAVTVSQDELATIPKGRSFQSVIPFAPGARQEPMQSGTSSRDGGFQIDGASDSENVYLIDGINTTNIQNGGVGKSFQTDFIEEVQIKSSSFEAEFGGALGGVINAIPKRGSNGWHGEFLTYLRTNALNANDPCASGYTSGGAGTFAGFSTVCGLRLDPTKPGLNSSTRLDGTPEYYVPNKDKRRIVEPGFQIGGPIFRERLWLFTSYIPTIDTISRTTTFTGNNSGPRTLSSNFIQHNAYTRLDYRLINSLNLFAGWNYSYSRTKGTLGSPDSAYGQVNTGASTDPNTLRSDNGSVNPLSVYTFGGDWTPTSRLVVSARYGYFFSNNEQRGKPTGIQWNYSAAVVGNNGNVDANNRPLGNKKTDPNFNPCTTDVNLAPLATPGETGGVCLTTPANSTTITSGGFSAPLVNTSGFSNIPSTFTVFFDAYKRKTFNVDVSYFVGRFLGSHTFKGGYFHQSQYNNTLGTFNTAQVLLNWATAYSPVTSTTICDPIIAQNASNPAFGGAANATAAGCQGQFGYYIVRDGVDNTGADQQTANALYVQDSWTVGKGLTLNLGVRFDEEDQPPYDPARFPTVHFGFSDKIAPRIGGAYDLFHNGKVKVFASYGQFYDIMKMGLARGSFGSDYWHDCVYTLDSTNYAAFPPTAPLLSVNGGAPAPHACTPTGPAPGVTAGRFIENVDFRATKADPRDPAIDPNMKPMKQHEVVTGVDWAINPNWSLETRYSRKRLDSTIEDMSITDNLGFYIGNPGQPFADVLHRSVVIPDANGNNYLLTTSNGGPFCAECPAVRPPVRNYDGVEFRLLRRPADKWFGAISYTYSKLRGNYAGLTNTDPTDGGGGRHSPNNGRAFDLPNMTYNADGSPDYGPLATDRPHTATIYGYYRQKWFRGQATVFGLSQSSFQGSPINTCLSVVGTGSACQWIKRGSRASFHRDPTGAIVLDGINTNARTDPYFQTDFSLTHEIPVSKAHEAMRLKFEANITNLLNNRTANAFNENVIATGLINPTRPSRFSGDPGTDWGKVMNGFNFMNALNGTGTFAGVQSPRTLASRYGMATVFQGARNMQLAIRFIF